ncbi:MAG: saccharopine dehydrogenase [Flammeovirgaceae bacterium]|nr:saccharopine dehydrogenase [Flammeovirgaceae bacterium]MBE62133.1 saccharopine dehydrogenase [Flammeovirgaceae bacterium]MBR09321.1 saccharopine dehydrogenase [Rickettsiales bacterium]HCX24560.1 saccharopine dehydrogenase [Cytophagales bacterium]|tara:strand:- start:5734 stop:7059 length:1326 start_codon:yes stop_codon:yes gene_type:complete
MKQVLILGAGRSSTSLINYLLEQASKNDWKVVIGEQDTALAKKKFPDAEVIPFDILDTAVAESEIEKADLVISMIPASLHIHVASICAEIGRDMLTASYVSDDIKALSDKFAEKGNQCIMELGLDPGIDHMSAMKVLDRIKSEGHELTAFETFTGGLLANDDQLDNPWKYKFTWNPRNVVLAGTGNVKFIQEDRYKYIPYHRLFTRTEVIHIPGYGYFEGYANRDSLKYLDLYNLRGIKTLYRGTLRRTGFCKAWNIFVQLGATDDTYQMENVSEMTHRQFINSFLQYNPYDSVELKLAHYLNLGMESEEMYKLQWLDVFSNELVGLEKGTPAQILEHILKKKWTLKSEDKDMIVMWHKFNYLDNGQPKEIQSHMVAVGDDSVNTAMSKTVGLPLAIAAKLVLQGNLKTTGVHIPTIKEIYEPILEELELMGFEFSEREIA